MHADLSGVVRRELEERIALAANGDDDAVLLQLVHHALDLLARQLGVSKSLPNVFDREEPVTALAEKVGDRLSEAGGTGAR